MLIEKERRQGGKQGTSREGGRGAGMMHGPNHKRLQFPWLKICEELHHCGVQEKSA